MPMRGPLSHIDMTISDPEHSIPFYRTFFEALGCGALKLREGSLYPALYRLENAGFEQGSTLWITNTSAATQSANPSAYLEAVRSAA